MEKGFLDWFLDNYFSLRSSRVDLSCLLSFFFVAATRLSPITKMADLAFLIFMPGRQFHDMPKWTASAWQSVFHDFFEILVILLPVPDRKGSQNVQKPDWAAEFGNNGNANRSVMLQLPNRIWLFLIIPRIMAQRRFHAGKHRRQKLIFSREQSFNSSWMSFI